MCVFYLFADPDRTTVFSTFIFGDSVKLLRLLSIRLIQHDSPNHDSHNHSHGLTVHIAKVDIPLMFFSY